MTAASSIHVFTSFRLPSTVFGETEASFPSDNGSQARRHAPSCSRQLPSYGRPARDRAYRVPHTAPEPAAASSPQGPSDASPCQRGISPSSPDPCSSDTSSHRNCSSRTSFARMQTAATSRPVSVRVLSWPGNENRTGCPVAEVDLLLQDDAPTTLDPQSMSSGKNLHAILARQVARG